MPDTDRDDVGDPREEAHVRKRDRKRSVAMVVDNAGVKRIQQALARRREKERDKRD